MIVDNDSGVEIGFLEDADGSFVSRRMSHHAAGLSE
jgi:hypothetical protein